MREIAAFLRATRLLVRVFIGVDYISLPITPTQIRYHACAMAWLVLLLLASPLFYLGLRLYARASEAPPVSLRAFLLVMCCLAALVLVVLVLSSTYESHEGPSDDDGPFRGVPARIA